MATVSLQSTEGKWVLASAILASAMAFIDGTALNVVLPSLQKSLGASGTDLFWVLNAYLLMLSALMLIGGSLGDKLGLKNVFIFGILIFLIGSAACGFSESILALIISRLVQGAGGALMIPGSLALISASINPNEKGKAIGTWSAFTTVVTVGGPILGGALADAGLWQFIFFINIPIGIITLLMLWFKVKNNRDAAADTKLDYPGAITVAFSLALLTFGFLRIPAVGLYNWQVTGGIGGGIILLLLFLRIEKQSPQPMMPLRLFANLTFSGANLLTLFLYAGLGAAMLFLSLNLVQVQGYSQLQSGLTFLPFTLMMILVARFAGSLADRFGPRLFLICGPGVAGIGLVMLSFVQQTNGPAGYFHTFFPGIFIFGLGMSFTVAPLTTTVMGAAESGLSGTASGINNAATRIAGVFANAIFGALAVLFFTGALATKTNKLPLREKQMVLAQAANLGDAKVPAQIPIAKKILIKTAFKQSFISAYGKIIKLCAGLCFLAALMALLFIKNKPVKTAST